MLSKEKINTGRQLELDMARGLAVLFMIFIHTQLFFANEQVFNSVFGGFNDFVGMVPSAPMFMFLLGVGLNYTRKSEPKLFFKRGLMLLLTGYVLNFLKGTLPCFIKAYNYMDIYYFYEGIAELFYVDILQFSGLAMMLFGVFKKIKANNLIIVLISGVLISLNIFLLNVEISNGWMSAFLGLIWGTNEYSYFPFLTWIFYPIAGYIFGSYLIRCTEKKKFYIISAILGLVILVGGAFIFNYYMEIPNGMISDELYYHHIITDNIIFTGMVILEIATLYFTVKFVPKRIEKIIGRWSKNVSVIFFIHWILITWSTLWIEQNSLGMGSFLILLIIIIVISDLLALIYSNVKTKIKKAKKSF